MRTYLTDNEVALTDRQKDKLLAALDQLKRNNKHKMERDFFNDFFQESLVKKMDTEHLIMISSARWSFFLPAKAQNFLRRN